MLGGATKEEIVFISIRFIDSVQIADADMHQTLWNLPHKSIERNLRVYDFLFILLFE